jgi:malate dehydrogenase (oxaloacetate-decarboxylating)(NADP+)
MAIISAAALLNALKLVGKDIDCVRLAVSGAGAIACLDMMYLLGVDRANVHVADAHTLAGIVNGADVFLGCSGAGGLEAGMVGTMAARPVILTLGNPEPDIRPEVARAKRPDCIIATRRSDYPNQVSNVLCFPYIFRAALDCGATRITDEMKLACVKAIAGLAEVEANDSAGAAHDGYPSLGPEYIIPKPFDPRLLPAIAPPVVEAARAAGVATRPITDMAAYRDKLDQMICQARLFMTPIFDSANPGSHDRA